MLSLFSKEKLSGNKKIIENLVLFLILFIIVIVVINSLGEKETTSTHVGSINQIDYVSNNNNEKTLEEKLQDILSLIDGAGKVNVLISYSNGIEQVPMYDVKQNTTTVQESDTSGGVRKTEEISNEQNIIFNENGNVRTPVIKQTINPKVVGVLVIADGANNLNVKENLIKAVEATLDVSAHRVQVFARKK